MEEQEQEFIFTIALRGVGANTEAAWQDAVEAFTDDPGDYDADRVICVREEDGE
jgi:hypothetical protein